MTTFRVYPAFIFTPAILFGVFLLLAFWFVASAAKQAHGDTARPHLLARTVIALILPAVFAFFMLFLTVYMGTKRVVVDDYSLRAYSLFDVKEVAWKDISSIDANFTLTTRPGLFGRGSYAWVDLNVTSGQTVHLSLRFLTHSRELQDVIEHKIRGTYTPYLGGGKNHV